MLLREFKGRRVDREHGEFGAGDAGASNSDSVMRQKVQEYGAFKREWWMHG